MAKNLTAIVLAAGVGKRLGESIKHTSKPLIPIGGKTLIHHTTDFCRNIGAERTVVVGGFKIDLLKKEIVDNCGPDIDVVENSDFEDQNFTSFFKGLQAVQNCDLFVCNADYIFMPDTPKIVKSKLDRLCVFASFDLSGNNHDVMKINIGNDRNLIEMSKKLDNFKAIYTGMFFIPHNTLDAVKKITHELMLKFDRKELMVESLLLELINRRYEIGIEDIGKSDWFEIDTVEDRLLAEEYFTK